MFSSHTETDYKICIQLVTTVFTSDSGEEEVSTLTVPLFSQFELIRYLGLRYLDKCELENHNKMNK